MLILRSETKGEINRITCRKLTEAGAPLL